MTAADWNASEALYAFIGWLTSRRQKVTMSATNSANEPAMLIAEFAARHGLPELRDGWEDAIAPELKAGQCGITPS